MKNLLLGFLLGCFLAFLVFKAFAITKHQMKICDGNISFNTKKFKALFPGGNENCTNIILKSTAQKSYSWIDNVEFKTKEEKDKFGLVSREIENDEAIQMIQKYNELHNIDLTSTSFIDFDRTQLMNYLIDILDELREDKSNVLRVYLASRGKPDEDSISTIITSVSSNQQKEASFINPGTLNALDWGGLHPPPQTVDELSKPYYCTFLLKAIERSRIKPITSRGPIKPKS